MGLLKKKSSDRKNLLRPKFEACFVIDGFQQIHVTDFDETFTPVINFSALMLMLAIVAFEIVKLLESGLKAAVLNEDLSENRYMKQHKSFDWQEKLTHICKLLKLLYGLKQEPRQ